MQPPVIKPSNPRFGSGPTAKRPGWSAEGLSTAVLGRSHRAAEAKKLLVEVAERSRKILGIPSDYRIGIVPASDTGAFECAMWSLLGARGIDVVSHESFGEGWLQDITEQLRLEDVRALDAPYGTLPDLRTIDPARDTVFCWNGTTSGVAVPNGDWIAAERAGLTLCDATSAAFAMDLPWAKLDCVTWSWQKVLGGEGQHGMLVLSPRAVERLQTYVPPWPLPKIFRLSKGKKLIEGIFAGETINTPSMLAVLDALDGLQWAERIGGLPALMERSRRNLAVVERFVQHTPWAGFLAKDPATRSSTSVCLSIEDATFVAMDKIRQQAFVTALTRLLADAGVAYDIAGYRDAPPGLRIWCGATVEESDLEALMPWLAYAFHETKRLVA